MKYVKEMEKGLVEENNEALEYLICWRKAKYKLWENNINTIHKDMKKIRKNRRYKGTRKWRRN